MVVVPDGQQLEDGSGCSTCDYHIAQDADDRVTLQPVLPAVYCCMDPLVYQGRFTSSIGLGYADRGPPAFFS